MAFFLQPSDNFKKGEIRQWKLAKMDVKEVLVLQNNPLKEVKIEKHLETTKMSTVNYSIRLFKF